MSARTLLALALAGVVALGTSAAASLPDDVEPVPAVVSTRLVAEPTAVEVARPAATASLGSRVSRALAGSTARTVSAAVDVDGLGAVLRQDAGHALPPASTQKSFVVGAALLALGPDARMRTEVVATTTATAGVLPGHLWLVAGGDPYLTKAGLRTLARAVRDAGVTTVQGDVKLDDSRYDALRRNPGWKSSWVPGELGPLSALAVDRNAHRRDAAFLRDPALPNAVLFRDYLRAEGVSVGTVTRARRPAGAVLVAERQSGPLTAVVAKLLKASDNFAAELLLKEVGRVVAAEGSSAAGLRAVRQVLAEQGVPVGAGADGSGLSSLDRQTTAGQVTLLRALEGSPAAAAPVRAALPVACVDGTLKKRMCGTPAAGTVRAKTGTLSGVTALAGYATTRSGRPVRFAFQLTGVTDGAKARAAVDRAAVVLASSTE